MRSAEDRAEVSTADRELDGLLSFFYQCPVGLVAADSGGRVLRINPAAVARLTQLAPADDLADLPRLLAAIAPTAAAVLAAHPDQLGRLGRGQRLLVSVAGDPTREPAGVEVQLVRVDRDVVMAVLLDITAELELAGRRRAAFVGSMRHVLSAVAGSPDAPSPISLGPVLDGLVATVDVGAAAILLVSEDTLRVSATAGDRPALLDPDALLDTASRVYQARAGMFLRDSATTAVLWPGVGSIVALPIVTQHGVHGVVVAVRAHDDAPFTTAGLLQVEMYAGHAAFALERAGASAARSMVSSLADRERQGLALHDELIQSLFATGLRLEGLARDVGGAVPDERVLATVGELDAVIRQLRQTLAT